MSDQPAPTPNPERLIPPIPNAKAFLKVTGPLLSAEQCQRIVAGVSEAAWSVDRVDNPVQPLIGNQLNQRQIFAQPVALESDGWPLAPVLTAIGEANTTVHRYRLTGFEPDDPPQVVRLDDRDTGDDRFKLSANATRPTRKLGFLVQLSSPDDYEGGQLEFEFGSDWDPEAGRPQGSMLLFPAFQGHRTTRVTRGVRYVLAGYVHGPSFS